MMIPPTNTVTRPTPLNPFTSFTTQGYYSLFIADSLVLDVPNSCQVQLPLLDFACMKYKMKN